MSCFSAVLSNQYRSNARIHFAVECGQAVPKNDHVSKTISEYDVLVVVFVVDKTF